MKIWEKGKKANSTNLCWLKNGIFCQNKRYKTYFTILGHQTNDVISGPVVCALVSKQTVYEINVPQERTHALTKIVKTSMASKPKMLSNSSF